MDKLVRMANQIGDFFAIQPQDKAVEGVAVHLKKFWTPKMISELTGYSLSGGVGLAPIARAALRSLAEQGKR
ncbi:MAG: formate dehydrogenase [Bradyrhizobium sp.]|nr:MAG: formate dehydrogenase [Bradyrhizobium sp.]